MNISRESYSKLMNHSGYRKRSKVREGALTEEIMGEERTETKEKARRKME